MAGVGSSVSAGTAICEGGLLLDLSTLRTVEVDPAARLARVAPGVTLGGLDAATQRHALATPVGINSTTGVAGLTLGGGFGWLSRKHGLTIDNLVAADVVTADGQRVRASERDDAELFWAIRGGGGNFGVVTSFEYRLHPIGPEVLSGLVVHPAASGEKVLEGYRRAAAAAPDEATCWVVLRKAPPLPFLPAEVHASPEKSTRTMVSFMHYYITQKTHFRIAPRFGHHKHEGLGPYGRTEPLALFSSRYSTA